MPIQFFVYRAKKLGINPKSWLVLAVVFVYGSCLAEAIHMVFLPVNTFVVGTLWM